MIEAFQALRKGDYVDVVIKGDRLAYGSPEDDRELVFRGGHVVYRDQPDVTVTLVKRPLPTAPGSVIVADQKHAILAGSGEWFYVGNTRGPSGPELYNATVLFDAGEGK